MSMTPKEVRAALKSTTSTRQIANVVNTEATSFDVLLNHSGMESGWATETSNLTETATFQVDRINIPLHDLDAKHRANASFVMNSKTAGAVRKMKDADGRFLWSDGLAAGEPARSMGYPVLIAEDMPDTASGTYALAFGDFRNGYTIAERPDLRMLSDPFSARPHVLFYASKRVGGDVSDFAAIKLLKFAASKGNLK